MLASPYIGLMVRTNRVTHARQRTAALAIEPSMAFPPMVHCMQGIGTEHVNKHVNAKETCDMQVYLFQVKTLWRGL